MGRVSGWGLGAWQEGRMNPWGLGAWLGEGL